MTLIESDCDPAPFGDLFSSIISTLYLVFMGSYSGGVSIKLYDGGGHVQMGRMYFYTAWYLVLNSGNCECCGQSQCIDRSTREFI